MKRIKVLYLHVNLKLGGAETNRLAQLRHLDRDRFEPIVAVLKSYSDDHTIKSELEKIQIPVFELHCPTEHPLSLFAIRKCRRLLKKVHPDILHSTMFAANSIGRLAAFGFSGIRVIAEEQNRNDWKAFRHILIDRLLAPKSKIILCCSQSVADFTSRQEKIRLSKFKTLLNCVDPSRLISTRTRQEVRRELDTSEEAAVIVGVGRICPQKCFEDLVRAFFKIPKKSFPVELWILGGDDGESRRQLEAEIHRLEQLHPNRNFNVRLLGQKANVGNYLGAADIYGHSAKWEGLPIVILEALHYGLPVAAFSVDGIPEIIEHGKSGFLIKPGEVSLLGDALSTLIDDPNKRAEFGAAGREIIDNKFSPKTHIERLQDIYCQILEA